MKRHSVLYRIFALWLSISLTTPPSVAGVYPELSRRTLRQVGLEESSAKPQLTRQLKEVSAGQEEDSLFQKEAAARFGIEAAASTAMGGRPAWQDRYAMVAIGGEDGKIPSAVAAIVADGSGEMGAEVAEYLTTQLSGWLRTDSELRGLLEQYRAAGWWSRTRIFRSIQTALENQVRRINKAIIQSFEGRGTSMLELALVVGSTVITVSAGDSRVYWSRGQSQFELLTRDHIYLWDIAEQRLAKEKRSRTPTDIAQEIDRLIQTAPLLVHQKAVPYSALGFIQKELEISVSSHEFRRGDRLLVVADGIWQESTTDTIRETMTRAGSITDLPGLLITNTGRETGDNKTALLLEQAKEPGLDAVVDENPFFQVNAAKAVGVSAAVLQEQNNRGHDQQDDYLLVALKDSDGKQIGVLAALADGHKADGKAAALAVIERLAERLSEDRLFLRLLSRRNASRRWGLRFYWDYKIRRVLAREILQIDEAIFKQFKFKNIPDNHPVGAGGAVMALALVAGSTAFVANVGDARVYRRGKNKGFDLLTKDHTNLWYFARDWLIKDGVASPTNLQISERIRSMAPFQKKNEGLYRSMGQNPLVRRGHYQLQGTPEFPYTLDPEVNVVSVTLKPGDNLLLVSDGVHKRALDNAIATIMDNESPGEIVQAAMQLSSPVVAHESMDDRTSLALVTAGQEEQIIEFTNSRSEKIVAAVLKPAGIGKFPVAFVFHGFTGNKEEEHIRRLAEQLTAAGYLTIRPDFRHNRAAGQDGTNPQVNQSHGELKDYSLDGVLEDVATLVEKIPSVIPEADFSKVVLAGHSYGGWAARRVAALSFRGDPRFAPLKIKAVADLSGVIQPRAMTLKSLMNSQQVDLNQARQLLTNWERTGLGSAAPFTGQRYWLAGWDRYSAVGDLSAIPDTVPYIYFVGDQDDRVLGQGIDAEYGNSSYQGVPTSRPVGNFLEAVESRGAAPVIWKNLQHAYAGPRVPANAPKNVLGQTIKIILERIPAAGLEEQLPAGFEYQRISVDSIPGLRNRLLGVAALNPPRRGTDRVQEYEPRLVENSLHQPGFVKNNRPVLDKEKLKYAWNDKNDPVREYVAFRLGRAWNVNVADIVIPSDDQRRILAGYYGVLPENVYFSRLSDGYRLEDPEVRKKEETASYTRMLLFALRIRMYDFHRGNQSLIQGSESVRMLHDMDQAFSPQFNEQNKFLDSLIFNMFSAQAKDSDGVWHPSSPDPILALISLDELRAAFAQMNDPRWLNELQRQITQEVEDRLGSEAAARVAPLFESLNRWQGSYRELVLEFFTRAYLHAQNPPVPLEQIMQAITAGTEEQIADKTRELVRADWVLKPSEFDEFVFERDAGPTFLFQGQTEYLLSHFHRESQMHVDVGIVVEFTLKNGQVDKIGRIFVEPAADHPWDALKQAGVYRPYVELDERVASAENLALWKEEISGWFRGRAAELQRLSGEPRKYIWTSAITPGAEGMHQFFPMNIFGPEGIRTVNYSGPLSGTVAYHRGVRTLAISGEETEVRSLTEFLRRRYPHLTIIPAGLTQHEAQKVIRENADALILVSSRSGDSSPEIIRQKFEEMLFSVSAQLPIAVLLHYHSINDAARGIFAGTERNIVAVQGQFPGYIPVDEAMAEQVSQNIDQLLGALNEAVIKRAAAGQEETIEQRAEKVVQDIGVEVDRDLRTKPYGLAGHLPEVSLGFQPQTIENNGLMQVRYGVIGLNLGPAAVLENLSAGYECLSGSVWIARRAKQLLEQRGVGAEISLVSVRTTYWGMDTFVRIRVGSKEWSLSGTPGIPTLFEGNPEGTKEVLSETNFDAYSLERNMGIVSPFNEGKPVLTPMRWIPAGENRAVLVTAGIIPGDGVPDRADPVKFGGLDQPVQVSYQSILVQIHPFHALTEMQTTLIIPKLFLGEITRSSDLQSRATAVVELEKRWNRPDNAKRFHSWLRVNHSLEHYDDSGRTQLGLLKQVHIGNQSIVYDLLDAMSVWPSFWNHLPIWSFNSLGEFITEYIQSPQIRQLADLGEQLDAFSRLISGVMVIPGQRPEIPSEVTVYVHARPEEQRIWNATLADQLNQPGTNIVFNIRSYPQDGVFSDDGNIVVIQQWGIPLPAEPSTQVPAVALQAADALQSLSPLWLYSITVNQHFWGHLIPVLGGWTFQDEEQVELHAIFV